MLGRQSWHYTDAVTGFQDLRARYCDEDVLMIVELGVATSR